MKRSLSFILVIITVVTLLSSCADTTVTYTPSASDEYDFTGLTLPEKKDISYPVVYTALDEIEYDTANVLGTAQIEDKLYLLESDGVHMLNLADGTNSLVFENEGLMFIASNRGEVYVTDAIFVYTLDSSGALMNTQKIPEGAFDKADFEYNTAFISTDDYLVLACTYDKVQTHIYISKSDMSVTVNEKPMSYTICSYEGNKYWTHNIDSQGEGEAVCYDIDTGKKGEKHDIDVFPKNMRYDVYSGNFIFYSKGSYGMELVEFTPEDGALKHIARYFTEQDSDRAFLTVYGNLYCSVSDNLSQVNVHDMQKGYDCLNVTVLGYAPEEMEYVAYLLDEKYGVNVTIDRMDFANQNYLPLKLMAGDTDIDIFYNLAVDTPYYVKNSCFVDLNEFEVLQENIEACEQLLQCGFSYNGKLFGIPFKTSGPIVVDCMNPYTDQSGNRQAFNVDAYKAKYINLVEGTLTDNGDAFYDLIEHFYDNKSKYVWDNLFDSKVNESISKDTYVITSPCYMMNPASLNKENAALFLNEIMNIGLGNIPSDFPEFTYFKPPHADYDYHYDMSIDYSKASPSWMSTSRELGEVLSEARNAAINAEQKSELRSIAKEYYSIIRQIILE